MKKSKLIIAAGAFVALTLVLGIQQNDTKLYEKKKNFNSPNEILEELNDRTLREYNVGTGRSEESDDVLECFSERDRLTDINIHYSKMEIKEIVPLSDEEENIMINTYNKMRQNYSKRKPVSNIKVMRIKVQPYYFNYSEDGQREYEADENLAYLNLVFVDEGEGIVIDYISKSDELNSIEG